MYVIYIVFHGHFVRLSPLKMTITVTCMANYLLMFQTALWLNQVVFCGACYMNRLKSYF